MDISIITFTLGGRPRYLAQCLESVYNDINNQLIPNEFKVEHHLIFQGALRAKESATIDYFKETGCYKLIVHEWPQNIGIGAGLNAIIPQCEAPLIFKMDDDCKIVSTDFFESALALSKRFPTTIFSPTPTGLVNNMGGPPGIGRSIIHNSRTDSYSTIRYVSHVGGFARFCSKSTFNNFTFAHDLISGISGTEDGQLSQYANINKIPMFYVETGMVVEHNEGLAQQLRYPEYFKERVGDLQTYEKWIK